MDDKTLEEWLDELASKQPAPGGGAAAALMAAAAAALIEMVTVFTTGEKWQDRQERMQELNSEAKNLRTTAVKLIEEDAAAFERVSNAYKLPKDSDEEKKLRAAAVKEASLLAAEPPRRSVGLAKRLIEMADELTGSCNPNVISDVAVASSAAKAVLESAIVTIEINERYIDNYAAKESLNDAVREAEAAIQKADAVTAAVKKELEE